MRPEKRTHGGVEPPIDDDTLAAFVDGALGDDERQRVLEAIARDPETYRVFVESAAFAAEQSAEESGAERPVRAKVGRTPRLGVAAALAAAALLLLVSLPIGSTGPDAGEYAERMRLDSGTRIAALVGRPDSLGFAPTLSPAKRAVRLGALVVDLEVGRRLGDAAATRRAASGLLELAAGLDLPDEVGGFLREVEGGEPPTAEQVERLERELRRSGDRRAFDAGRTLEAVRLAAALGVEGFTEQRSVERALRRAEGFELPGGEGSGGGG